MSSTSRREIVELWQRAQEALRATSTLLVAGFSDFAAARAYYAAFYAASAPDGGERVSQPPWGGGPHAPRLCQNRALACGHGPHPQYVIRLAKCRRLRRSGPCQSRGSQYRAN